MKTLLLVMTSQEGIEISFPGFPFYRIQQIDIIETRDLECMVLPTAVCLCCVLLLLSPLESLGAVTALYQQSCRVGSWRICFSHRYKQCFQSFVPALVNTYVATAGGKRNALPSNFGSVLWTTESVLHKFKCLRYLPTGRRLHGELTLILRVSLLPLPVKNGS